ncbi:LOB domain-containing protein 19 [Abrus precatorius]|uniref:LOB domain-containing protein 19 n=1 Tax=Abrus precatorius TaxID=3816 RepID=A0A8B8K3M7_ABRPR|nr:LOB domain-containing protein 19 [Abrus precatorius]
MDLGDGRNGPCGACKFLRRKCVKGCIFAPYFDSGQGTAHFAAVHKVFGASNASKLLTRVPPHKRLDAVVTLCYEALARATDPVYGSVGHIFALQQQVVNLQAELAYVHARLSTLHRVYVVPPFPESCSSTPNSNNELQSSYISMHFDNPTSLDLSSFLNPSYQQGDEQELQALARDFVSRFLPGINSH